MALVKRPRGGWWKGRSGQWPLLLLLTFCALERAALLFWLLQLMVMGFIRDVGESLSSGSCAT